MLGFDYLNKIISANAFNIIKEWLPDGRQENDCWISRNPNRQDEKIGSLIVDLKCGKWEDKSINEKDNDFISLHAYLNYCNQSESIQVLSEKYETTEKPEEKAVEKSKEEEWKQLSPIPKDAPEPFPEHYKLGKPAFIHEYKSEFGVHGYMYRFELQDKKEILPLTYCRNNEGNCEWRWRGFDKPRPLYNLHLLQKYPKKQVIILLGEKKTDQLQALLKDFVCVSFPHGDNSVKYVYWELLKDRKCVIWPDADNSGMRAATEIYKILSPICKIKIINPPKTVPKGWDVGDAIVADKWDANKIIEFIKNSLIEPTKIIEHLPPELPDTTPLPKNIEEIFKIAPFQVLGYDRDCYYYHPYGTKQVIEVSHTLHSAKVLLAIAPLSFWETHFPAPNGIGWNVAIDALYRFAQKRGVYDMSRIRGCGVWMDNGRAIVHCGDYLLVDEVKTHVCDVKSRYIYEAASKKNVNNETPLEKDEANILLKITDFLPWEKPIYSRLLAGWIVLAPLSGALPWRPHIQITGPVGCGKSFTMDYVVSPLLGDMCVQSISNCSEAGIRQALKRNAFPVVFDEAEGENIKSHSRIQQILELMRQASSNTGASILKGTPSGSGMNFKIHSCFCIASVGVPMTQYSDISRISVLTLKRDTSEERKQKYEKLQRLVIETITPKWATALRARSIKLIRVILNNIRTFSLAASEYLGTQRKGDQVGALLAGAYSLCSDSEINYDDALKWIQTQDWEDYTQSDLDRDEISCFNHIMQRILLIHGKEKSYEKTISEIIGEIKHFNYQTTSPYTKEELVAAIGRYGIKFDEKRDLIIISNSHQHVKNMLNDTAWLKNWGKILTRLDGAEKIGATSFFGSITRATGIPYGYLWKETTAVS